MAARRRDLEPGRELPAVTFSFFGPEPDEGTMKLRSLLLAAPLIGVFLFVTAGAASGVGQLTVSDATPHRHPVHRGDFHRMVPGRDVTIGLNGTDGTLGAIADATGSVHARVTVPSDVTLDFNTLSVTGTAASGVPQQIVTALEVHGTATHPPSRPWALDPRARLDRRRAVALEPDNARSPHARLAAS